jgi:hypothetical protein
VSSVDSWICERLWRLDAVDEILAVPPGGWERVVEAAEAEGLAAALAYWVERHPGAQVPAGVAARLGGRFRLGLARHVVMGRDLAALLRALEAARIPVVPLKGAVLGETLYPHPALRAMSDIDVLVRFEDRLGVDAVLRGLGYRPGVDAHSWEFDLEYDAATFYDGPGGGRVDVHWRLLNDPRYRWDDAEAEAVWTRAVPVTLAGVRSLTLAAEDLVLSLAAHLAIHHGLTGLRWYWDLALLLDGGRARIDWDVVVTRAERWRVRRALFFVLTRLGELFALPADVDAVRRRIAPRGPRARAVGWLLARRADRLRRFEHVLPPLLADRARDMLRVIGPAIWPSPAWIRARYGNATTSLAGAYLAHGGMLAGVLGGTGRSLLAGATSRARHEDSDG